MKRTEASHKAAFTPLGLYPPVITGGRNLW